MRKFFIILFIFVLPFYMIGCTPKKETPQDSVTKKEEKKDFEATLYYANEEYVETGDESLDKLIPVKKNFLTTENRLPLLILKELKKSPDADHTTTEILSNLTFLSVETKNGIAYVDMSSENLNGGSLQEFFIINQIVYSLTELPHIDKVQFLIDGEKRDSIMGHFTIDEPIGRESL